MFSSLNRLRSLISGSSDFRRKVNQAFVDKGYPPPIEGPTTFSTEYRIDLNTPPRFVWFRLAEVYVQYLPENVELTYDVRKGIITNILPL